MSGPAPAWGREPAWEPTWGLAWGLVLGSPQGSGSGLEQQLVLVPGSLP